MKVSLLGNHYSQSFGDILMLELVRKWIKETAPEVEIDAPMASARVAKDIGMETGRGFDQIRTSQLVIYTGGGGFGVRNPNTLRDELQQIKRYLMLPYKTVSSGIPFVAVGMGVGPWGRPFSRYMVKKIVRSSEAFAVREEASDKYLQELGIPSGKYVTLADIALTVRRSDVPADKKEEILRRYPQLGQRPTIGIHVTSGLAIPKRQQFDAIFAGIKALAEARPELGFAFIDDHPATEQSRLASHEYVQEMKAALGDRVVTIPYEEHWLMLALLDTLSGVITSKLHVGICCSALGRKAVSFAAHAKAHRFYKQIHHPERCISLKEVTKEEATKAILDTFRGDLEPTDIVPADVRKLADGNQEIVQKVVAKYAQAGKQLAGARA